MSVAAIADTARTFLRDYPKYFEVELGPLNVLTIRLPHPLVSPQSLKTYVNDGTATTLTTDWELDDRNGLLKFTDESLLNQRVLVSGYHYTWFSDSDLLLHSSQAAEEVVYASDGDINQIEGIYTEVTAMGAVTRALWSLALEFSFDIDVSTPEGMFIPARQRFAQVIQMMQYWEGEYNARANALNIGLGALEVFRLRRISYTTNRYVPVYAEREIDDPRPPKRLYPPIPDGALPAVSPAQGIEYLENLLYTEPSTPDELNA